MFMLRWNLIWVISEMEKIENLPMLMYTHFMAITSGTFMKLNTIYELCICQNDRRMEKRVRNKNFAINAIKTWSCHRYTISVIDSQFCIDISWITTAINSIRKGFHRISIVFFKYYHLDMLHLHKSNVCFILNESVA